jgi:FkbM family methyltransferase
VSARRHGGHQLSHRPAAVLVGSLSEKSVRKRRISVRLDVWEIVLLTFVVAVGMWVTWHVARPNTNPVQSAREMVYFRERYGPTHYSEREEEWMIRDYFQDRRGGFFVDVGANHYRSNSKTYYLESELGWSGLAIEPQREFAAEYAKYRLRAKFFPFFVDNVSNATAKLYMTKRASMVASSDKEFVKQFGELDEVRDVPTITLANLLDSEGVQHIDFLSIDIELHEPRALAGFDIERFKPALVCIEALQPVRQQILDYFTRHHYAVVGKYIWVDLENLYFAPLAPDTPK